VDVPDHHHPKGALFYNSGWVADMEAVERKEKQLSEQLGFVDSQKALHGIPASGPLHILLSMPLSSTVIVCESQAPLQSDKGCNLAEDVTFWFSKTKATFVKRVETDAASYLGKRHCVVVGVPETMQQKKNIRFGVQVTNREVTLAKGPCSISHILWAIGSDKSRES